MTPKPKVHWAKDGPYVPALARQMGEIVLLGCGGHLPSSSLESGRTSRDPQRATCWPCRRAAYRSTPAGQNERWGAYEARCQRLRVVRAVEKAVLRRHAAEVAELQEAELTMFALGESADSIVQRLNESEEESADV